MPSERHNDPIAPIVAYVPGSACRANDLGLCRCLTLRGIKAGPHPLVGWSPVVASGRQWSPSSHRAVAAFSQHSDCRAPRTSHSTDSAMPKSKKELDRAIQLIMNTPNSDLNAQILKKLRKKFNTESVLDEYNATLSTETREEFVEAVRRAGESTEYAVRLWKRVRPHLVGWEIAGSPISYKPDNLSERQRPYLSMSAAFDITRLDQPGRDLLFLLAYARVEPMPQEKFDLQRHDFQLLLSSCKNARVLLQEYLSKDKFLKRAFSAPARKLPIHALVAYDTDHRKRTLNMTRQPPARYQGYNRNIP
jgi:hypothetical protein